LDLTHSLPSIFTSIDTDYLPKAGFDYLPSAALDFSTLPQERTVFPDALDIASENPTDTAQEPEIITKEETIHDQVVEKKQVKRIQLYAPNEALMVPYVSPVFDPLGLQGLPPLLIESGGAERLHDEAVYAAYTAAQQAPATAIDACQPTNVTINVYEGQPHVFQMFVDLQASKQSFETIGSFIQHVTRGEKDPQHRFVKQFERYNVDGKGQSVDVSATAFSTETWAEWKKLLANPSVEQRMEEAEQYGIKVKGV
jgi:acetyl esterase/lipase